MMTMSNSGFAGRASQQGAILIVALIFLTVLTLMAVSAMDTSIVEERMAGNMQDLNQAFQAAEVALEDAEGWLSNQINLPATSSDGTTTVWTEDGPDPDADGISWWNERDTTWWENNAESSAGLAEVAAQPMYIIEDYHTTIVGESLGMGTGDLESRRVIHRVTALGFGGSESAQVMLQSTYIRPYD